MDQNFTHYPGKVNVTLKSAVPEVSLQDMGVNEAAVVWHHPDKNLTTTGGFTFSFMVPNSASWEIPCRLPQATIAVPLQTFKYFIADELSCPRA